MSRFFIDRPVFAWVLALFVMAAGVLALPRIAVSLFPSVVPPTVMVSAAYPGASPQMLDLSVTSVIEEELNGALGMQYFESQSDISGNVSITATFASGTNPDLALLDVQERVRRVEPRLPRAVIQNGVHVRKSQGSTLMMVSLISPDGSHDQYALGDYLSRHIVNELKRLPGVGNVRRFGSESAMRIWIDPLKLAGYGLTPADVTSALAAQNVQVAGGAIGELPNGPTQQIYANVAVEGQLSTPRAFGDIVLRASPGGAQLRLRDVARIESGGQDYLYTTRLNGKPSSAVGVNLTPDGNALETARAVHARMAELGAQMPAGVAYRIPFDQSVFVSKAIAQVLKTLAEAIVLVFVVMYLFLHNLRYTLIPTIVVPIALLGAVATLGAFGFSINILTLFGMVLAIGLLVDDAIVVVENVERIMREEGLGPREATIKAMRQITGAVIGITTVLSAVFVPMALLDGSVGQIYRQFSVSIVASMIFSAFAALILTPALCATMLTPVPPGGHASTGKGFGAWFDRRFDRLGRSYGAGVARMLGRPGRSMVLYAIMLGVLGVMYARLPTAFLPIEDQGYLYVDALAPSGATQPRTERMVEEIEKAYLAQPGVGDVTAITGFSLSGTGQNAAFGFITLKDWSQRGADDAAHTISRRANAAFASIRDGLAYSIMPPAIPGIGTASGFAFQLQDRAGHGERALASARETLLARAAESPKLVGVRAQMLPDAPQIKLEIDRGKASAMGVSFDAIASVLSSTFGSSYVNDYPNAGRMQRVIVQADAAQRMQPEHLLRLHVRNEQGDMVPFGAFAHTTWTTAPVQLSRYNGFPSASIAGQAAPGSSSGEAMAEMERLARELPNGFGFEWTGQSLEERRAGGQLPLLLGLSLLTILLCLAALYESWKIPFAILLVVPLGIIGAVLGVTLRGLPNDVYFKIGMVATIGLSAKNAILIVEFARAQVALGKSVADAALEAARLRFRPIVMTSLAFMLGVVPLVVASGPGSAAQRALGTGVLGGMISATVLAIFLVPVFFTIVMRLGERREKREKAAAPGAQTGH